MFTNRKLFFFSFLLLMDVMTGCGGSSSQLAGPPQGGFTNASLSGSYAFAVTGTNSGGFFTLAGSFQANGSGALTGGVEDINSPGTGVGPTNVVLTCSYTVPADGRPTPRL